MINNIVKTKWSKKQTVLNSFLSIPNTFTAEIMSEQGYDALTIDYQHGMIGFNDLFTMLQSIRNSGVTPICRVSGLDHAVISKVMDAGALGVICPMINTRQQAEQLVQDCKYPPVGIRSFGPTRANFSVSSNYFYEANEGTFCLAMIETQEAFDNLDDILSVPNLSGIYIGPADMSISYGLDPKFDVEEEPVYSNIKLIAKKAKKYKKIAGIHNGTTKYAKKMLKLGFSFVTISSDFRLMMTHAKNIVDEMNGTKEKTSENKAY